jgi:hypothetical protein
VAEATVSDQFHRAPRTPSYVTINTTAKLR